jgi:hypothetical protein
MPQRHRTQEIVFLTVLEGMGTQFFFFIFLLLPLGALDICETLVSLQFINLRELVGLLGRGSAHRQTAT